LSGTRKNVEKKHNHLHFLNGLLVQCRLTRAVHTSGSFAFEKFGLVSKPRFAGAVAAKLGGGYSQK
jgi:hypothetical protein